MANVYESPKSRINSGMLPQYISKPVCFVGCVETVHPSGKSFVLIDGEGKKATVELNDPIDEELSGIVEVIGMVSNKAAIVATAYQILRDDKGTAFDLELYNEALKIIHDFPEYYPFEVSTGGFNVGCSASQKSASLSLEYFGDLLLL